MKDSPESSPSVWQKTAVRNLVRSAPSGKFFARIRVKGKLLRRSLKTSTLYMARLRLSDLDKAERQVDWGLFPSDYGERRR